MTSAPKANATRALCLRIALRREFRPIFLSPLTMRDELICIKEHPISRDGFTGLRDGTGRRRIPVEPPDMKGQPLPTPQNVGGVQAETITRSSPPRLRKAC